MDINAKMYHNDMTKIAFVLSFMDEGDASSWKEQFLEEATSTSHHNYGTWADFKRDLREAFQPFDAPGDGIKLLRNPLSARNQNAYIETPFRIGQTTSAFYADI